MKSVNLGEYVKEFSERNRENDIYDVYSVTNSSGFIPSDEYFSKEVYSKNVSNYKIVKNGMLAYNPSRINVGSVACQNKKEIVIVSPLYVVVEPNKKYIDSKFLSYFLHSSYGIQQIRSLTSGSVRDSLKYSAFEKIKMNLPSLEEQNKIIKNLDKLNEIIALRKEQLKKLDEFVKSLFSLQWNKIENLSTISKKFEVVL